MTNIILTVLFHLVSSPNDVKQMQFYWPNDGTTGVEWCEAVSVELHKTMPDNIVIVSTECVEV